jgi:hypothetical protein
VLSQAELNFYGFNLNNIIARENRGRIKVILRYDANNKLYVVTRRTPKTLWEDRYIDITAAKNRYYEFLYTTNKQLNNITK